MSRGKMTPSARNRLASNVRPACPRAKGEEGWGGVGGARRGKSDRSSSRYWCPEALHVTRLGSRRGTFRLMGKGGATWRVLATNRKSPIDLNG